MATIKEYLDYAELAQASYSGLNNGMSNTYLNQEYKAALISGDFTSIQATDFANRYTVLAVSNNPNGFSATLFTDTSGNKYLSIRGSDDIPDVNDDFWNGLVAGRVPPQYESLVAFFENLKASGQITVSDKVVVTGHSLGGALAQMLTATYPSYIDETYTYNSPGAINLSIPVMEYQGQYYKDYYIVGGVVQGTLISKSLYDAYSAFSQNKNGMDGKVTSLYAQEGDELAAGLGGGVMGTIVPISITPQLLDVSNHRMKFLTNSLHLYDMLSSIAQTQDLDLLTSIMVHSTDNKILDVVKGAFGIALTGTAVDQAINLTKNHTGEANGLIDLYPKSPSQIATQAKSDSAVLYALTKLNPFAIEGNLPAYTNLNRTDMSDKYLEDRAQYLYYLLDKTNRYDVDPTLSMTHYEDAALGAAYTLKQSFSRSRVLFGGGGTSTLRGGEYGDRLYGMGGDDTLTGNGGDDYMEGGIGYDKYITANGDTIKDSDGSGRVTFEGRLLTGGTRDRNQDSQNGGSCSTSGNSTSGGGSHYKGDGGEYTYANGQLIFTSDSGETLVLENYYNTDLGITLTEDNSNNSSGGGGGSCPPPPPKPSPNTPNPNFSSPLVLDLNGDGVTSTFISSTSTYFDLDNDGMRERTGWAQTTDALLAFDKNRDGIINDGSELFGNYTTLANGTKADNGFTALAQYDNNHDGVIDKNDSVYNALSAWVDSDQDGVTDTGELHSLSELGAPQGGLSGSAIHLLTSINLNATTTTAYEDQNAISHTSSFPQQTTDADGNTITETQTVNDVWFKDEIQRKAA